MNHHQTIKPRAKTLHMTCPVGNQVAHVRVTKVYGGGVTAFGVDIDEALEKWRSAFHQTHTRYDK
jgi:hypothetical protein